MIPKNLDGLKPSKPKFINCAIELNKYLRSLNSDEIEKYMQVSSRLAIEIKQKIDTWSDSKKGLAMFSFRGDVYSGLQVDSFNMNQIEYAQNNLRIVSGLYGLLKPLDEIAPYRLEMGYKLPDKQYNSLYKYWGDKLSSLVKANEKVVNLTSVEYGKVIIPKLEKSNVVVPVFYTYNSAARKNSTVAVHSKIARGAFAHWLIKIRADNETDLTKFNEIGYSYAPSLSSPGSPTFVCKEFGGKGLSVRLK